MDAKVGEFIERLKTVIKSRNQADLQHLFDDMLRYRMEAKVITPDKTLDNLIKVVNDFLWNRHRINLEKVLRSNKEGG